MKKNIFVPTVPVIKLLKKVKEKVRKEDIVKSAGLGFLSTAARDLMLDRQPAYI